MNKYVNDRKLDREISELIKSAKTSADELSAGADFIYDELNIDDSKWEELIDMCNNFYEKLSEWENDFK